MKVIIEDIVKEMEGVEPKELPSDTTIRFEVNKIKYSVSLYEGGIKIYKCGNSDDTITITAPSCNVLHIK